jgi:uncharacterized protein (DUF1778 family)
VIGNGLPVQIELSPGQMNDQPMAARRHMAARQCCSSLRIDPSNETERRREKPLLSTEKCRTFISGELPMPSARKKAALRERKTERLELRVAPSAKRVIQQAMSATGLAAGDLAYEGARRLLEDHQRMVLAGVDRDAFLAAIDRKPEPARRLVAALRRHRKLFG